MSSRLRELFRFSDESCHPERSRGISRSFHGSRHFRLARESVIGPWSAKSSWATGGPSARSSLGMTRSLGWDSLGFDSNTNFWNSTNWHEKRGSEGDRIAAPPLTFCARVRSRFTEFRFRAPRLSLLPCLRQSDTSCVQTLSGTSIPDQEKIQPILSILSKPESVQSLKTTPKLARPSTVDPSSRGGIVGDRFF